MIKIGILPTYSINNERPFLDTFSFVSSYVDKVFKNGGVPFGIFFPKEKFDEKILSLYDGFIIPGGGAVRLCHILTVQYAFIHNKPLLGICMGMQVIGIYSKIIQKIKEQNLIINYENISEVFCSSFENEYLKNVSFHNKEDPFYRISYAKATHAVYLCENSILRKIYKEHIIFPPSIHNYALNDVGDDFLATALSFDGVIEGLECAFPNFFIIGVQFHIELDKKYSVLFKYFIYECLKRNKCFRIF